MPRTANYKVRSMFALVVAFSTASCWNSRGHNVSSVCASCCPNLFFLCKAHRAAFLFLKPWFFDSLFSMLLINDSCWIICSRNSCFLITISSISFSFYIVSSGVSLLFFSFFKICWHHSWQTCLSSLCFCASCTVPPGVGHYSTKYSRRTLCKSMDFSLWISLE